MILVFGELAQHFSNLNYLARSVLLKIAKKADIILPRLVATIARTSIITCPLYLLPWMNESTEKI
jgi:hypothetical protein